MRADVTLACASTRAPDAARVGRLREQHQVEHQEDDGRDVLGCAGLRAPARMRIVTSPADSMMRPRPGTLSVARRALHAFAERSPATQADIDEVMRALVSHDDWYVPVLFADRAWGQTAFHQMLLFPDAPLGPVLNAFTDHESAMLAEGQAIGVYGGPVPGTKLMRALDSSLNALVVNHASPREHQWYIASAGFEIAIGWASAIIVERALAARGNGPAPMAELLEHRYHLLLERPSHALAQVYLPDIDGAVSVSFTATDRAEEFIASLPPDARPLAELTPIDGPQLFAMMRGVGAAGLVVNAGSDDQTALTREDIAEIAARV
jgi:hypothetical protein